MTVEVADLSQSDLRAEILKRAGYEPSHLGRGNPPKQFLLALGDQISEAVNSLEGCLDPQDGHFYGSQDKHHLLQYGPPDCLTGLPEMREVIADMVDAPAAQSIVAGHSVIEIMERIGFWMKAHGLGPSLAPWPSDMIVVLTRPCYDRHKHLIQQWGAQTAVVEMEDDGPDVEALAELVEDPRVVLFLGVSRHSNPSGICFSKEKMQAIAKLEPANPGFRCFFDEAYWKADFPRATPPSYSILDVFAEEGAPDRAIVFLSLSKVLFAGSSPAGLVASPNTHAWLMERLKHGGIGPSKLPHALAYQLIQRAGGIDTIMKSRGEYLQRRFDYVQSLLQPLTEFTHHGRPIATWTVPDGGYFILVTVQPGFAREIIQFCEEHLHITLTPGGSTEPLQAFDDDSHIRLAVTSVEANNALSDEEAEQRLSEVIEGLVCAIKYIYCAAATRSADSAA